VPGVPAGALGEASVSETENGERPAIVPLKLAEKPALEKVRESIVHDLKELLEQAERGELEALVWFADSATSRGMAWGSSGALDQVQLIGRIEVIRHSLLREFTDGP
jgi:hypothetical protein